MGYRRTVERVMARQGKPVTVNYARQHAADVCAGFGNCRNCRRSTGRGLSSWAKDRIAASHG